MLGLVKLRAETRVVRPAVGWAVFAAVASSFVLLVPFFALLTRSAVGVLPGVTPGLLGTIAFVVRGRKRARDIVATEAGLVADTVSLPSDRIRQGYFQPLGGGHRAHVVVDAGDTVLRIDVEGEAQARTLLGVLGLGVGRSAARFSAIAPLGSRSGRAALAASAVAVALAVLSVAAESPALFVIGALVGILARVLLVPANVVVGADGVAIEGRLHRELYPISAIRDTRRTRRGIAFVMRDREVTIPLTSSFALSLFELPIRDALLAYVRGSIERARTGEGAASSGDALPTLERGEGSFAAWVRALGHDEADFRTPHVPTDALAHLVASTSAPALRRVGAAIALAKRGTAEDRTRVRVAARAVAAPKLRVALERIADQPDDTALEEAVREVEEEERLGTRAARTRA